MAVWTKSVAPALRVIGVQSTAARTMYESRQGGRVVEVPEESTLADGLAGGITSENLALVQQYVDEMVLVEEDGLPDAMQHIWRTEGHAIEGAAAVGPAAILQGKLS